MIKTCLSRISVQRYTRGICVLRHLQLFHEIITVDEEAVLMKWIDPIMKRKRYEGNHWDDVISKYKEVDSSWHKPPDNVYAILNKIEGFIKENMYIRNEESLKFISPHLIDLAPEGSIGGHVDSVKFSGDLIAGLSLLSSRYMYLTPDRDYHAISPDVLHDYIDSSPPPGLSSALVSQEVTAPLGCTVLYGATASPTTMSSFHPCLPSCVSLPLPPRSLYILQGIWRYNYAHSVSLPILNN
eukprot:gene37160-45102_t